MALTLSSPAFADDERIPDAHVRKATNLSPPLEWSGVPKGTKSFVLIVEDPDAPRGTFRHWAVYDIPAYRQGLEAGEGRRDSNLKQGANDFGNPNYDGPQPPPGTGVHHYHFRLAALDVGELNIEPQELAAAIWDAAQPNVIETAELVGVYER